MKPSSRRRLLSELYRSMLRIRMAEQKIVDLYPSDKIQSPIHLSIGQEAACVGVAAALREDDHLYATYRGHGPYLAKGGGLNKLFAELYGKDTGCARGRGGSMHLVAPERGFMGCSAIVGSTIPVAVGDALAGQLDGRGRVSAAFFGDGAIDEGVFFESLNFAALKKLPILFVIENNGYAIHSRVAARHKRTDLFRIGESLGVRGSRHDGDDVELVYKKTAQLAASLRRGGPPMILELMTFRWREHVGAGCDWTEAYRTAGEQKRAEMSDPLMRAQRALKRLGTTPAELEGWTREIAAEVDAAVAFAEKSPFPDPRSLLSEVYA